MKLSKIEIKNYRGIRDFSYSFSTPDDILVLGGLNGSGKSSVLEACLLALGQPFEMREPLPDQDYHISLELQDEWGHSLPTLETTRGKQPARDLPFNAFYFSSWRAPKRVHGVGMNVGKKGNRPRKKEENALWNLKQLLVNIQGYSGYASGEEMKVKINTIFSCLNRTWNIFFPGQGESFFVDIEKSNDISHFSISAETKFDLFLDRPELSAKIPVDELSSGEIELLCLFGTLIAERTLNGRSYDFVFLDEPELHLNPVWHRTLLPALQECTRDIPGQQDFFPTKTQFIVATHSDGIWDSAYTFQRLFLQNGRIKED